MLIGLLPALTLISITWHWWEYSSLFFLLLPLLVGARSFLFVRRFKLYADDDVMFIDKSAYGTERILLQWYKLQTIVLQQSLYQRSKQLATLKLYTAAGTISVPYISISTANEIVNYGLYKIETAQQRWM
jgi:putative membrane protein